MTVNPKAVQGFTLVEVLVVMLILGIIAAVAYPSYTESVKQTRRSDAMSELLQIMQQQERFFVNNNTYTIDLTDLGYDNAQVVSANQLYTIAAAACAGNVERCVRLTATPMGTLDGDGTISLSSRGEKTATGDAAAADVWG